MKTGAAFLLQTVSKMYTRGYMIKDPAAKKHLKESFKIYEVFIASNYARVFNENKEE